jgi:hypothetical protein
MQCEAEGFRKITYFQVIYHPFSIELLFQIGYMYVF